jgi:hypothetical protein
MSDFRYWSTEEALIWANQQKMPFYILDTIKNNQLNGEELLL